MKPQNCLLTSLFCLGLWVTLMPLALAQENNFQTIAQPLPLKLGVTAIGLGLIALEIWWFLSKRK